MRADDAKKLPLCIIGIFLKRRGGGLLAPTSYPDLLRGFCDWLPDTVLQRLTETLSRGLHLPNLHLF